MSNEQMVTVFKAFSDESRLQILDLLKKGELCANDILEKMNISQSTLSHHMKILVESGVIAGRKEGKWTYYSISAAGKAEALELIGKVLDGVVSTETAPAAKAEATKKTAEAKKAAPKKVAPKKATPKKSTATKKATVAKEETPKKATPKKAVAKPAAKPAAKPVEKPVAKKEEPVKEEPKKEAPKPRRSLESWLL